MDIRHLFDILDIDTTDICMEFWQQAYEESQADDAAGALDTDHIEAICEWLGLRDELIVACLNSAKEILACREAVELLRAARHIFLTMYHDPRINTNTWPMPCPNTWASPSMFYVIVFLSCVPQLRDLHRSQGVPDEATRDIVLDLESKIDIFIREYGYPGLNTFRWFAEHFNGQIFQLGRLQFQFSPFRPSLQVFKHVAEDKLAVLACSDQKFRPDGQYFNVDHRIEPDSSIRISDLKEDGSSWRGIPILLRGCAGGEEICLPKDQWTPILKPGDAALNIHIPANTPRNGPLTRETCRQSFELAIDFFQTYFPDYAFKAFMCQTWMLDPQLADYLPPESKIVQFQDWFHLYPFISATDSGLIRFVFGETFPGWEAVPQITSLQRIAVRHVRAGKCWRVTGGFCLKEEIQSRRKFAQIDG